jgi:hypothetical protein
MFVNIERIVAEIDAEISRLQQAKQLLSGPGRPRRSATLAVAPKKRRTLSVQARARIAAAQKARWAKVKKKASGKGAAGKAAKPK